jgi:hypothetical protein
MQKGKSMDISLVSNRDLGIDNETFLTAIFGSEWGNSHVTAFPEDPDEISQERKAVCWGGGPASTRLERFKRAENQYYTISLFKPLEGRAVRRKSQFDACFVIVADDVGEKIPAENIAKLPPPSYKLMTSAKSEQWGWILDEPCSDRSAVENLLDGLVAQGLAPNGVDPGMRGVTRYVRLPMGSNTKAKRKIEGRFFECYIYHWEPQNMVSMAQLAQCFNIDLTVDRGNAKTALYEILDSELVRNHPVRPYLNLKGVNNEGWVDVTCPNIAEHTGAADNGSAIRFLQDGSLQFSCHHGHCNGGDSRHPKITGGQVVRMLDKQHGLEGQLVQDVTRYKLDILRSNSRKLMDRLEASDLRINETGKLYDTEESADGGEQPEGRFLDEFRYIYMAPRDKFYDTRTTDEISRAGIDSRYLGLLSGGKKKLTASQILLNNLNRQTEADGLGWAPVDIYEPKRKDIIYQDGPRRLINTWKGFEKAPVDGDPSPWLEHADYLFPDEEHKDMVLDYLACLVQRVGEKPAFFIAHRGAHRIGKDLFYKGLVGAMGGHCAKEVKVDDLVQGWGDYRKGLKLVIIPEVMKEQNKRIANAMKTIVAPTATGKNVLNMKGGAVILERDVTGGILMSNKRNFMAIEQGDERYLAVDSWVKPKTDVSYYTNLDRWYRDSNGYGIVLNYLLHRDIAHFDHRKLPKLTEGAQEMMDSGRSDFAQDLEEMIAEGHADFATGIVSAKTLRMLRRELGCGKNGLGEALNALGWVRYSPVIKKEGAPERCPTFYTKTDLSGMNNKEIYDWYLVKKDENEVK